MKKIILISALMVACIGEANCFEQPEYDLRYNFEGGRPILDMRHVQQDQQGITFTPITEGLFGI